MGNEQRSDGTFRALLRFWRSQRGMSQLDLGLAADVSARHISFLETGRSRPSIEMVGLLGEVLDVPLRNRNELLRAAGFEPSYPEPSLDELLASPLGEAIDAMLKHSEPYPLMVVDRWYRLVQTNSGGRKLLSLAGADLELEPNLNLLTILFDPELRPAVSNWDEVAGQILRRLQRSVLRQPDSEELNQLLADLLATPGLPEHWRVPDLSGPNDPMVSMEIGIGDIRLRLLMTLTVFHAPNNVTLEELQLESYFPLDDATREFFVNP
ncbi:MAG: helix-turn-helix domain-containing protein [Acidimicrobiales bacterium]